MKEKLNLSITNDFLFKEFFRTQNSEGEYIFLKSLVESLLNQPVDHIELKPTEINGDDLTAKDIRLDLLAKINQDKNVNLEMQTASGLMEVANRAVIYLCQILLDQQSKGIAYSDFNETHVAFFVLKNSFPKDAYYHQHFRFTSVAGITLTNVANIHIIEVYNGFMQQIEIVDMTMLLKWIYFMLYRQGTENEKIMNVIESEDILKEGLKVFNELTQDEIMKDRAFARQKWERDIAQLKYEGRQEALAEGRIEGLAEGRMLAVLEMAKNMLSLNVDVDIIMKATGLTSAQIEELKE